MARRGQKAKEHPLVAGEAAMQPTIVQYGADDGFGALADESIASLGQREPARARGPGRAPSMPSRAREPERSRSDGVLAPERAAPRGPPRAAARPGIPNVSATSTAARSKIPEPARAPTANRGKVPSYLKTRKQELNAIKAAEEEEKTRERVPEGLRRVSADEQAESLEILRERKTATEAKYARLPLRCNTNRARLAKEALEEKIQSQEQLIKAFSKPKVYVPRDVLPIERGDEEEEEPSPEPQRPAFDRPSGPFGHSAAAAPIKTHTQVLQPPGGRSNFSLAW